jgi:hypothetical protein
VCGVRQRTQALVVRAVLVDLARMVAQAVLAVVVAVAEETIVGVAVDAVVGAEWRSWATED